MSQIHVASAGEQLVLPGALWPAGCDLSQANPLFFAPITKGQANELLAEFGHPLGAYRRPFGFQAWGLAVDGIAVAVAVSGSTVGATSAGYPRREVVELARIARHPKHPGVMRVMLRLWRLYLATRWPYWPVRAVVSYALPRDPESGAGHGNLYRFDGWTRYGTCRPWAGGGSGWSNPSKANGLGDGIKILYRYEYPKPAAVAVPA